MHSGKAPIDLIIKTSPVSKKAFQKGLVEKLKQAGISAEIISGQKGEQHKGASKAAKGKAGQKGLAKKSASAYAERQIIRTDIQETEFNPWDLAHLSLNALQQDAQYIEPDFLQEFTVDGDKVGQWGPTGGKFGRGMPNSSSGSKLGYSAKKAVKALDPADQFDPDWPPHINAVWHLDDSFSQLAAARNIVAGMDFPVRIAHIDTGYSKTHSIVPSALKNHPLQRNFVEGEDAHDAADRLISGMMKQPGHGTGTYGILAGGKISSGIPESAGWSDYLGGAYFADVIPCRISPTVVLLKTSAFADALDYLTQLSLQGTQVHVASMSMGGAPSQVWADAVNAAYEAGIMLVSAAGNNFNGLPTRHVIYPARFQRVTAACGVTYDFKPYLTKKAGEMQGCFGPTRHMQKAIAAFTPNMPWASVESGGIRFSGAGTSAATPQVAAAAAIYYRKYAKALEKLKPWQRVEAIRYALFSSAKKSCGHARFDADFAYYFGNGILQAGDALDIPVQKTIAQTPADTVPWFPILNTIFKAVPDAHQQKQWQMFNTELAQLVYNQPSLAALLDPDKTYDQISKTQWTKFREAVIADPATSRTLKRHLRGEKEKK